MGERERENECTKLGGASLPHILTPVMSALGPHTLLAPGSPKGVGPELKRCPSVVQTWAGPSRQATALLPPMKQPRQAWEHSRNIPRKHLWEYLFIWYRSSALFPKPRMGRT